MFEKVKSIIVSTTNVDANKVVPTASLKDDLGIDSLDSVELVLELENEFNVTIEDSEVQNLVTVQDIVTLVEQKNN